MNEVPVAVVHGEIAEALVRVKEQVFVPRIGVLAAGDLAHLKTDHFVLRAAEFAARSQRNGWLGLRLALESLEDLNFRRGCIEDAVTLRAHHTERVGESAELDRSAAVGA